MKPRMLRSILTRLAELLFRIASVSSAGRLAIPSGFVAADPDYARALKCGAERRQCPPHPPYDGGDLSSTPRYLLAQPSKAGSRVQPFCFGYGPFRFLRWPSITAKLARDQAPRRERRLRCAVRMAIIHGAGIGGCGAFCRIDLSRCRRTDTASRRVA